jgi:hypothetical protein
MDKKKPSASGKIPDTHFLFDGFNKPAQREGLDESLAHVRILNIFDRFAGYIQTAGDKMEDYCRNYRNLEQGALILEAEEALDTAESVLRQLSPYGVDTAPFAHFVLQCRITCHVLHAQGLYDLMLQGKGDFTQNEFMFKRRVSQAVEAFKKVDSSDKSLQLLQDMIVQAPKPEVPAAIALFLDNYQKQRAEAGTRKPSAPDPKL